LDQSDQADKLGPSENAMRFKLGVSISILGLVLFAIGVLTPIVNDPNLSPAGQRRGTYFFFGLMLALGGLFLIFTDLTNRDKG
jgi:hypothetical protein